MKTFDWNAFCNKKNHIAVRCKTKKEADDFLKAMDAHGLKWCDGQSYLKVSEWRGYKEDTAYSNQGEYCRFTYYQNHNYTVLEWSDFMYEDRVESVEEFLIRRMKENAEI